MAFGNVIPIDADVARQLARRQVRFRWLVAGLVALWLAVLVPTLLFTSLPPLAPFLALAALVVLAEHRFILFGDETSMSASIIVIVASVFVFADTAPLSGPLLIASIAGLYLPHLRAGSLDKVAFNGAGMGLAAWSASIVAFGVNGLERSPLGTVAAVVVTLAAYWTINNIVVAGHQATLCGQRYTRSAVYLIFSDTDVMLWAAAACIGAIAAAGSAVTGVAFVTVVVACRVALLRGAVVRLRNPAESSGRQDAVLVWLGVLALLTVSGVPNPAEVALALSVVLVLPTFEGHSCRIVSVGLPLIAILAMNSELISTLFVLCAATALLAFSRSAHSRWTASIALGALGVAALTRILFAPQSLESPMAILTAAVVPAAGAMVVFAARSCWHSRALGFWTTIGVAIPSPTGVAAACYIVLTATLTEQIPLMALAVATAVVALRSLGAPSAPRTSVGASH